MSDRMTTALVSQALFGAVATKRPANGLIHHSDRAALLTCLSETTATVRHAGLDEPKGRLLGMRDGEFLGLLEK